ncbi:Metallo-beta-lactamase family protein [uncultured delta proteobacterium]|uniref:Metallo-beta-lactamase family protein n=1 Tax=uncultured delta proteobacterium TaxID=34034 RepID=A0A212KD80_9DELT|nr:Metallo-beta-lactamase family protein [uncultured delta proteobacterium]
MKITFLGAAKTVTGSCYVVETDNARFAVDCGMHQGNAAIEERNEDTELYRPGDIDFFLVTHAHIDHSGLLPRMVREGFSGPVYCTEPTADLLGIMLADSAHIQEMEAEWATRKQKRRGAKPVEPLYTQEDAAKVVSMLSPISYDKSFQPATGVQVTYKNAGHILGAAFLELVVAKNGDTYKLIFSGDLGRPDALIVEDAEVPELKPDYLFMESTYGDRDHKNESSSLEELAEAIKYSHSRGEKVIIPAFAVERTQEILFTLHKLHKRGMLPANLPIYVDSPLAIKATEIFRKFPEYYDEETRAVVNAGEDPFDVPGLRFTPTTQESQAINAVSGPAVIISASGMANAGRVKHHLRHNLWRPGASVVFVGYQAIGTPGRKLVDGAQSLRLLGEDTAVKAKIFTIGGFSAHAGQSQLLAWVEKFTHPEMTVVLIHGEEKAQTVLSGLIEERFGLKVVIPGYLEELALIPGKEAAIVPAVALDKAMPAINWDTLFALTRNTMDLAQSRKDSLSQHDWAVQAEFRDKLLEINSELARFASQA